MYIYSNFIYTNYNTQINVIKQNILNNISERIKIEHNDEKEIIDILFNKINKYLITTQKCDNYS